MKATIPVIGATVALLIGGGSVMSGGAIRGSREAARITQAELDASSAANVYDAIRATRPQWLVDGAGQGPTVYLELRCTQITCLRWVERDQVEVIQLIDSEQSGYSTGSEDRAGVIIVTFRNRATQEVSDVSAR